MQGQNQQQAYDRGTTIFSPDGRLYQVEYAREAVERGSTSLGVRTEEGVVLVAEQQVRSPLMEGSSIEKLHKVDDHIAVGSAGHVADARQLVDFAREQAQVERLRYSEPIGIETLAGALTDHIQEYTQTGGARPFGVALLVAGIEDGEPRLFETDPSGTATGWSASAVGADRDAILDNLEANYRPDADLDGGIHTALQALASVRDAFEPSEVAISTIDTETEQYRTLDADEIETHLDEIDFEDNDE
ncbi:archaeal proteasome endopeptidase complex subunit alpha [Halococcus qingdaonensis]|uniref:archaeal proteasome endopeptidase complex subunit alpha n=1 Tax=Halococcus qingdaonensis TaxID=224402 RepID=UPI002116F769|nr:archaeal proteasome endopeptidase complex subunit alpha [Halococcus qingdaonensis]